MANACSAKDQLKASLQLFDSSSIIMVHLKDVVMRPTAVIAIISYSQKS